MTRVDVKSETVPLAFIDALRGFAIMGVIAVHTIELAPPHTPLLLTLARTGTRGVQLFFVVSAMTLLLSMASKSHRELAPYRNFYIRRFFRIAPLFTCAILAYPLIKGTAPFYFAPNGIKWWHFLLTATYTHGWMPESINSVVPGGWTIAVEMTFYLLVPLLFVTLTDLRKALLFLGFSLIIRVVANAIAIASWGKFYSADQSYIIGDFAYFWFFNQLPVFAVGIATYRLFVTIRGKSSAFYGGLLLLIGLATYLAISLTTPQSTLLPPHVLHSLSFSCVALALALYPIVILVNRFTCWIGTLSYSMYLTHFAVLGAAGRLAHYYVGDLIPKNSDVLFIAAFALFVIVTALVSTITHKLVERPGIMLGKRCINYLDLSLARRRSAVRAYKLGPTSSDT